MADEVSKRREKPKNVNQTTEGPEASTESASDSQQSVFSTADPALGLDVRVASTHPYVLLPSSEAVLSFPRFASFVTFSGRHFAATEDPVTAKKTRELENEIAVLQRQLESRIREIQQAKASEAQKATAVEQLKNTERELSQKLELGFLLNRVNEDARGFLLKHPEFQARFLDGSTCEAFVMSVDIRRSTELMSKARRAQEFARFMTTLCRDLEGIITANYGVFDKFTGDGVLAFFPDFFSGDDAGYYAIHAADQCHKVFDERYKEFRSSFISVLTGVGLGIGIDYGPAHLVQMAGGLTVVGAPVVYACRMSGAPAGTTLLNQPGYEKISERFSSHCFFRETIIDIKNEGSTLAYEVQLNGKECRPSKPSWNMKKPEVESEGTTLTT